MSSKQNLVLHHIDTTEILSVSLDKNIASLSKKLQSHGISMSGYEENYKSITEKEN